MEALLNKNAKPCGGDDNGTALEEFFVPTHTEREHVSSNGGEFKSRHAQSATRPGENALCVQRAGRRDQNQMRRPAAKGDIPRAALFRRQITGQEANFAF